MILTGLKTSNDSGNNFDEKNTILNNYLSWVTSLQKPIYPKNQLPVVSRQAAETNIKVSNLYI